ncbi:hypothetical protein J4727_04030 [Providencia rettgeri]|uniref:Uncharacterized protein n=1 Tax=Providencia rettgeri TaxID=587 RepID=A0A939SQJ4_PRORE|nr:hypothetical protein [Providencia rettgeri]
MQTNLQTKVINPQYNGSQIHAENIQSKMTSIWQEKIWRPQISINTAKNRFIPIEKNKVNNFIDELKSKGDDKIFFSHVFKTMIALGKDEKQNFIAGVSQALQSSNDSELVSLNKNLIVHSTIICLSV